MGSELNALRDAITARLAGQLSGVTVLSRKTGDLQNQIERELGQLGLVVVVAIASFQVGRQQRAVIFDPVAVQVTIVEDPLLNAEKPLHAEEVAEITALALANWRPELEGITPLVATDPAIPFPVARGGDNPDEDLIGWSLFFSCKLSLSTR